MAARAKDLHDFGESAPKNWEKPLGTRDVHVVIVAVSPDEQRLEAALDGARKAYREMTGIKEYLASELPRTANRNRAVWVQGRNKPPGHRGKRHRWE